MKSDDKPTVETDEWISYWGLNLEAGLKAALYEVTRVKPSPQVFARGLKVLRRYAGTRNANA